MVDLRKLKTLIDLVQQSGISELEITEGEERVRMLGHFLSHGINAHGSGTPQENMSKHLQEGIAGFLKQTAMAQREA